jgi:threonyl-tRNA synthetase
LDDRGETVGKKVREAKQDWVGYAIVIGDKELASDTFMVYDRLQNKNVEMSFDALVDKIKAEVGDMPNRPMYMPYEMSRQVDI